MRKQEVRNTKYGWTSQVPVSSFQFLKPEDNLRLSEFSLLGRAANAFAASKSAEVSP